MHVWSLGVVIYLQVLEFSLVILLEFSVWNIASTGVMHYLCDLDASSIKIIYKHVSCFYEFDLIAMFFTLGSCWPWSRHTWHQQLRCIHSKVTWWFHLLVLLSHCFIVNLVQLMAIYSSLGYFSSNLLFFHLKKSVPASVVANLVKVEVLASIPWLCSIQHSCLSISFDSLSHKL